MAATREPIAPRALLVSLAAGAVHYAAGRGFIGPVDSAAEQAIADGLVAVAAAVVTWRWSRRHTRPAG